VRERGIGHLISSSLATASRNFSIFASGAATAAIAIREGEEEGSRRGEDGRRFQMTGGGEVVVCETVWFALIGAPTEWANGRNARRNVLTASDAWRRSGSGSGSGAVAGRR
jgi:hypothetical protein